METKQTKVLILGANGMAGHVISLYLQEQGMEVHTITRRSYNIGINHVLDITKFKQLEEFIVLNSFDVIVNCIGILNQNAENNKFEAVQINSLLPHFLVKVTQNTSAITIHLSTDCVFSGLRGNYKETDLKDGETFYDQTKALGELDDKKNLTLRNSIIGPDLTLEGIGLFNWFMKQTGTIDGYKYAIWNGVTTLTLAKAIKYAIDCNLTGLYHLSSNPISKYELINIFKEEFKSNSIVINENETIKINKTLVNTRIDFDFVIPSHKEMVHEMKEWIQCHKELYPHYKLKE